MTHKYVLDASGNAIPEPDLMAWATWYEKADRRVAFDNVGDVEVSTVFLSLDAGVGRGVPVLWETMVFGGAHDQYQEKYRTRDEALAGHARIVAMVTSKETI